MSKSLGNLYTLDDLKHRGFTPAEVRYTLLSGHYRQPLNFTLHTLDASRQALIKLAKFEQALFAQSGAAARPDYAELKRPAGMGVFQAAWDFLLDDLNVPAALGVVFGAINKTKAADLSAGEATVAGFGLHRVLAAIGIELPTLLEEAVEVPAEIQALAEQRWLAKQARDWTTADDVRKQLELAGWIIKDNKDGFQVLPKA
jgi:cysteinyl-tRNA synthetase